MTAAMPGISACFDIGDGPPLRRPMRGHRLHAMAWPAWRCGGGGGAATARLAFGGQRDHGGGDAGNGAHGGFGLRAHALPGAGLGGIDIDGEEHLAVS